MNFCNPTKAILKGLAAVLMAAFPLKAQDATFKLGASISASMPMDDEQMAGLCKSGAGLGLFLIKPLGQKNGLQARGAYTLFFEDEDGSKINTIDASLEYLRYLPSNLYLTAGAGFVNATWDYLGSESAAGPAVMASLGIRPSYHLSIEARYTFAPGMEFIAGSPKIDISWFALQLGWRF